MEAADAEAIHRLIRHDVRTPLAVIAGRVELLLSGAQGTLSPDQQRSLRSVAANVERLEQMLSDLGDRIDRIVAPDASPHPPGGARGNERR